MENKDTKEYRRWLVRTSVGIQSASGHTVSDFFWKVAERYIEGEITLEECEKIIFKHYDSKDSCLSNARVKSEYIRIEDTSDSSKYFMNKGWEVLSIMRRNAKITISELADYLHISRSSTNRYISSFKKQGLLKRVNGKRFGYWEVQ